MASQQFIPQHILDPKNAKQAKLSENHIEAIKNGSGFPAHASIRFPAANERVDWHCDGWVNFFMYPFKIGMKFPFSSLVRDFLAFVKVSPSQVMPQVWRVLRGLEVLSEKHSIPFSFEDLGFTYDLRSSGAGRFTLAVKDAREALILRADKANDRGWMSQFFFVQKDSLGSEGAFLEESLHKDRKTIPLSYGPDSEGRTAKILSITTAERTFGNLVVDNEDDSDHESETSRGGGENASAFVPLQMVFPGGQDSCSLPAKRSAQHAAVSSSNTRPMPSDYDLLNMVSRKKKIPSKLASGCSKTPQCPNTEMKSAPPRPVSAATNPDSGGKMNASFSRDFCCLKDALMMGSEMPQVLLSSSSVVFSDVSSAGLALASSAFAFQSVQASLVASERLVLLEKAVDELKRKEKSFQARADVDARTIQSLRGDNSTLTTQISTLKTRIKSLEAYGRKKKQEVTDAACFYAWKTRGELMTSFLAGETSSWTAEQDVATWLKLQDEMDPPIGEDGFDVGQSDNEAESRRS
ncbi:unnamed protein product [Cuscuta europaea]|uniref:Uncharacterized protein n=1 Tax=Cuscuta europaea TaxID=41803 RepID=A0A9P0Z114_CUSEU|nr:unnamed protein product [Cuscuta europaea]